jgi:hypothetical protein
MNLRFTFSSLLALGFVSASCSSSSNSPPYVKKAATGAPAAPTKSVPLGSTGKPTYQAGSNLTSNVSSAAQDSQITCDATEEGLAFCNGGNGGGIAIFCLGGKAYALDCSTAFPHSACDELDDGTIDCVLLP